MALTNTSGKSSWIKSVGYIHTPDNKRWLVVFTKSNTAILYMDVPETIPGLLVAGQANTKSGERSVGATFNRLVKGKFEGQTVSDVEQINYLREVCK